MKSDEKEKFALDRIKNSPLRLQRQEPLEQLDLKFEKSIVEETKDAPS